MKKIAYITNADPLSGVGHRASHIAANIRTTDSDFSVVDFAIDGEKGQLLRSSELLTKLTPWPSVIGSKSINWWRLGRHLGKHFRGADNHYDIYHATNQTLSFLAKRISPTVVTVHDVIEILEPQDAGAAFVNRVLYSGIPKASRIIAVSEYTKRTIQEAFGIDSKRLTVIPNGVGREFHHIPNFKDTVSSHELLASLKLAPDAGPIVLYVGSDHPRKNLTTLVAAFAKVLRTAPGAIFIKVGTPGLPEGRRKLLQDINAAGIRRSVKFVNKVVNETALNEFYNLAQVFVFPSRFEGFGLPPLQAMAAGIPVVVSNATSLPEVVGDNGTYGEQAALTCDPDDVDCFAASMEMIISGENVAQKLRQKGITRARQFSWKKAAVRELEVYRSLL